MQAGLTVPLLYGKITGNNMIRTITKIESLVCRFVVFLLISKARCREAIQAFTPYPSRWMLLDYPRILKIERNWPNECMAFPSFFSAR